MLNASKALDKKDIGEKILNEAIHAPFKTILDNAGITNVDFTLSSINLDEGINVISGEIVNMINAGIIDPLLVTKSALTNAASVATTILSTDCVINNIRNYESNR